MHFCEESRSRPKSYEGSFRTNFLGPWGRGWGVASHTRLGAQPLLGSFLEEVAVRAQGLTFMFALLAQSPRFRGPGMDGGPD